MTVLEGKNLKKPVLYWLGLVLFISLSFLVGLSGKFATQPALTYWYPSLMKPDWTPPGWLFGPAWTVLYILMSVSAWLIWRKDGFTEADKPAWTLYFSQLLLNGAWSFIFFGAHQIALALLDISLLWLCLIATGVAFWQRNLLSGILLLPYIGWVFFAALVNGAIWFLNGSP
ncbi:MAG: tryptophan-rich sensory protein [Cyanobacteria bacterium]|nr:tryptophan-rich sensory protein [Cyanobacteriota bacterium]